MNQTPDQEDMQYIKNMQTLNKKHLRAQIDLLDTLASCIWLITLLLIVSAAILLYRGVK